MAKIDWLRKASRAIPGEPGVYTFFCENGNLVYVGQSKNLRRRILQYLNAKRVKKHLKMRLISRTSARLKFIVCASQLEAQLLENDLIQRLKPRFNIAGAFSHRYPFIGLMAQNINQQEFVDVSFVITREPEKYPGFQFHGVYRSWSLTVKAFESFMNLFSMIAIVKNKPKLEQAYRDQRWKFSRVSADYVEILNRLLSGEDSDISRLVLDLADSAQARKKMRQTQGHLNWIKYFMKHEISVLKKMRKVCSEVGYPISQVARDQLRLRSVLE